MPPDENTFRVSDCSQTATGDCGVDSVVVADFVLRTVAAKGDVSSQERRDSNRQSLPLVLSFPEALSIRESEGDYLRLFKLE